MNKPELLAPAGDLECLETALHFGADAVYLGGPKLQLRAAGVGFTMERLATAVETAHRMGKKVYVTVNCYAYNSEIPEIAPYARELQAIGVDAVIVSDIGVIAEIKRAVPELPVHVSTQANCQNYASAMVYRDLGASRVVLAREMSLSQIAELRAKVPEDLELEAFVHGAMCMSYSGRCMISAYLAGRSGNRGECAQPCRWQYALMEETRPGEYFPVHEDGEGMTILSSRDLCAIRFLDQLQDAGVSSFKIEGRMKSPYYVATVTNAYRQVMDALARGETPDTDAAMAELSAVSHRDFTRGFYFGELQHETAAGPGYRQDCVFAGVVKDYDAAEGRMVFEQRNRVYTGNEVEILSPGVPVRRMVMGEMTDKNGEATQDARTPAAHYGAAVPFAVQPGDILRMRKA
ncbi:MAG: U32 family peptidase [Ruminococcaceae bacterium]|nr:U32 family peptidase [Oscillospiraceae bacterium]